jgi:gluconate 2-dehydrogenase gamma chain
MAREPSRRAFLQHAIYSSFGTYLVFSSAGCRRRPKRAPTAQSAAVRRFFTETELATISSVCERLLPRDEDPGAIDLGVPDYIDRALCSEVFQIWQPGIRSWLQQLDSAAARRFEKTFRDASEAEQIALLSSAQTGPPPQREMFQHLLMLTLEGAFGDPSHGGNRDGMGWKMIGFRPDSPMTDRVMKP